MNRFLILILLFSAILNAQQDLRHEVYFETDKYEVIPTEESRLLKFIAQLDTLEIEKISIYGFCDDRGTHAYNMVLSKNRANSIKTIFSNSEYNESIITNVDGKGEILLRVVKETDVNKIRGLNRKVEIIVSPKTKETIAKEAPVVAENTKPKDELELLRGDLKTGDKIRFDGLLFKTGYSIIMPESKKKLDSIAKILTERNNIYFTIEGHVCCTHDTRDAIDRKTKKRNLSVARAKYVYDYLASHGVDRHRMKYAGMRRREPLGGDPKFDRRVEILITFVGNKN